jgi:hypothetical protein
MRSEVLDFLKSKSTEQQYDECLDLIDLMASVTGKEPKLWPNGLIGFGEHHYKYESGREGDWFNIGFSPRKGKLSIYIVAGFSNFKTELAQLGTFKTSVTCLYIKSLSDINIAVLKKICTSANEIIQSRY